MREPSATLAAVFRLLPVSVSGDDLRFVLSRLSREELKMIRKLKSGKYRLYSRKKDPKTGKRKNLGTFDTREEAERHERAVQYFKHKG